MTSRADKDLFLLPILTSYVRKHSVKNLEDALLIIKDVKICENETPVNVSADEALKYLLYLVDVNELYDVALGLYDFDLVMMVASKSQKDPKEYLPFLNDLRKLEINYQRYSIDKYLKRYTSALKNIGKCEADKNFDECMQLIKEHVLYKEALMMFERNDVRYKTVAIAYGHYLESSRNHSEAGIMFKRGEDYSRALQSFKSASEWQKCIVLMKMLKLDSRIISECCNELVDSLRELRRYSEASVIYLELLDDIENAVSCLVQGHLWADAFKICYSHNRTDIIETHIRSGLAECITSMNTDILSISEKFNKYKTRLGLLNIQKAREALHNTDRGDDVMLEDEPQVADCDLYSDTSSIAGSHLTRTTKSSGSGKSFRSSKNRRKHERKLLSLKEGSNYERPALITALHGLVVQANGMRMDVNGVCSAALDLEWDKQARDLQNALAILLATMERSYNGIWTQDLLGYSTMTADCTTNNIISSINLHDQDLSIEYLEQQLRYKPTIPNLNWKLDILN